MAMQPTRPFLRALSQRSLLLLFAALAGILLHLPAAVASEANPAALRVVLPLDYPPFSQHDEQGRLQGALVDLWRLWERKTGVRADLQALEWTTAQKAVLSGAADVIDAIYHSPDRAVLYEFSKPYLPMDVTVFFRAKSGRVKRVEDLASRRVGVAAGDGCIPILKSKGALNLKEYPGEEATVLAAAAGEVDAFVLDELPAKFFIFRHKLDAQLPEGFVLYKDSFRCAVKKGEVAVLALVERGFAAISENERTAIERRWLRPPSPWTDVLVFLGYVVGGVLALMLVVFVARRILSARAPASSWRS
jgi:ABC-type amino acid transport substrate-binding protein